MTHPTPELMPERIWAIRGPREEWGHHIGGYWDEVSSEDTGYILIDRADGLARALEAVIAVSDRKTVEYDRAKEELARYRG